MLDRAFAPVGAFFDLLEKSGTAPWEHVAALSESARALEQATDLVRAQAELFEHAIHALREPTELAERVDQ
jgi:hypothetical protein